MTPLRPRDFDIDAINRAAEGITIGSHGLLLRLYAFVHYLDSGDTQSAGRAIRDAKAVVHRSIGDTAHRLESEFVFGYCFAVRDPMAAREWWKKFEWKKPLFNSDDWKAACALHWVEGSYDAAEDAWNKGNALAQNLPNAGAYDFERHCFRLLRRALNGTTSKSISA